MKYSAIKEVYALANELDIDARELTTEVGVNFSVDFEVDNYRFIEEDAVFEIVKDVYKHDEYMLGCFNAGFISDNCNIPLNAVEALQKAEAYESIGEMMLDNGIDTLIEEYIRLDGVGHALSSYDGNYEEVTLDGVECVYFRTN